MMPRACTGSEKLGIARSAESVATHCSRLSSFSFFCLPGSPILAAMPLTFEEIDAICVMMSVDQAYSFPKLPFSREGTFNLVAVSSAVARLWLGDPQHGVPRFFKDPDLELHDIPSLVVERDVHLIERIHAQPEHVKLFHRLGEDEKFARTWLGRSDLHNTRPFIRVRISRIIIYEFDVRLTLLWLQMMFYGPAEVEVYGGTEHTVERMLQSSSNLQHVDLRLFVGFRDSLSPKITSYQRAKVRSAFSRFSAFAKADFGQLPRRIRPYWRR
jgi:hypothetical protein